MLKDLVQSEPPHVRTQSVAYRREATRRGARKQTPLSPPVMFFSVCAAFPMAIFFQNCLHLKKKKCLPLRTKTTAHEFPAFFFLTLMSVDAAENSAVICFLYMVSINACIHR